MSLKVVTQNKLISSLKSDLEYICVCVNIYTQIYSRVDFNDEINLFCVIYASQKHLSEMVGVTFKSISEIELNQRNPTLDTITKILDVLGYEINFTIKGIN